MLHKKRTVKIETFKWFTVWLIIFISQNIFGEDVQNQDKLLNWQMKQIYQPSQRLLEREKDGFVNIYDGFTDTQVNQIMDQKFERLNAMMFTSVIVTDNSGAPVINSSTGEVEVEDDGCD